MKFNLSLAKTRENAQNTNYGTIVNINTFDELKGAVKFDHAPIVFKDNYRKNENFSSANCVIIDCDNEKDGEWLTPEKLHDLLPEVEFAVIYSRNNQKWKFKKTDTKHENGKSPRPRFHVYFPLNKDITDGREFGEIKKKIGRLLPYFDDGASAISQLTFGVETPDGIYFVGEKSILDWIAETEETKPPRVQHKETALDDDEIIEKILDSKYASLWLGDCSRYPSSSEADLALCSSLAFYTNRNTTQIDRLFRRSALYCSDWDKPHTSDGRTYGEITISKAVSTVYNTYEGYSPDEEKLFKHAVMCLLNYPENAIERYREYARPFELSDAKKNKAWNHALKSRLVTGKMPRQTKEEKAEREKAAKSEIFNLRDKFFQQGGDENFISWGDKKRCEYYIRTPQTEWRQLNENMLRQMIKNLGEDEEISVSQVDKVLEEIKVHSAVETLPRWNAKPLWRFSNGILDLDTEEFRTGRADDYLFGGKHSYIFDPEATCPTIDKAIDTWTAGDKSRADTLLFGAAYNFFGTNSLQQAICIQGEQGGGKSTFMKMLNLFFSGEDTDDTFVTHLSLENLGKPSYLIQLEHSRVNFCEDVKKDIDAVDIFKKLISGERLTADAKFQSPHHFENRSKWWLTVNEMLKAESVQGLERRLLFVHFPKIPLKDVIPNFEKVLAKEFSGFFNKIYKYYKKLKTMNAIPACVDQRPLMQEFKEESDIFTAFLWDMQENYNGTEKKVSTIFDDFLEWKRNTGRKEIVTKNKLTLELKKRTEFLTYRKTHGNQTLLAFSYPENPFDEAEADSPTTDDYVGYFKQNFPDSNIDITVALQGGVEAAIKAAEERLKEAEALLADIDEKGKALPFDKERLQKMIVDEKFFLTGINMARYELGGFEKYIA